MRAAFEVIGAALEDLWETLIPSALCSVLWLLCMLLVVPGAPATVALAEMAQRVQTRDSFTPGDYLAAIRRNFGLGWRWGAATQVAADIRAERLRRTGRGTGRGGTP